MKSPFQDKETGKGLSTNDFTNTYKSNVDTNNSKVSFDSTSSTKLGTIEESADVTDADNVNSAGATMNADTDVKANGWVIDENDMTSNVDTKVPTQQSVKAYVDTAIGGRVEGTVKLTVGTTEPSTPSTGDLWVDTN